MHSAIIIVFVIGYFFIVFEKNVHVNKAAFSLLTGILCWVLYSGFENGLPGTPLNHLPHVLAEISGILFFLLAAMTIVALIDAHDGFEVLTSFISTNSKRKILWLIAGFTFMLSAVLDNLTTAIVMASLVKKIIPDKEDKMLLIGIVVIAANAGGVFSPIGDVTTTMLWMAGKLSPANIIAKLIFPAIVCAFVPVFILSFKFTGTIPEHAKTSVSIIPVWERQLIFWSGISALLFIPVFKNITHLPPFMGALTGLAVVWILTEMIHRKKNTQLKEQFSVVNAISKTDVPSILFFFGILLAVSVLELSGILKDLSLWLQTIVPEQTILLLLTGLISAVIDNVPLVAASIGMYEYPCDHSFWEFLAYTTGTGGSCLIIGSAAGVAVMGIEEISFGWYLKKVSLLALLGFLSGAIFYFFQTQLF